MTSDWKELLREELKKLEGEYNIPEGSLWLSDNKSDKNDNAIISHTVCIWEPDYPPVKDMTREMNQIVLTIYPSKALSRPDDLDLTIREKQEKSLQSSLPDDALRLDRKKTDIDTGTIRIRFDKNSDNLVAYIKENVIYCLNNYKSKGSSFGCCDRFEECSDAKKCLHPNLLYSKSCQYRKNLEQGRIFYGENRNVD